MPNPVSSPRISILVTNYNNAPWLRACLDSALAQTRPADEIVVYDDGSTDGSRDILRSYGDRIRWIEGPARPAPRPSGLVCQVEGVARALAASTGDLIFMLDGDDCYLPRRIELGLHVWAERPEANLVQGPVVEIDEAGTVERELRFPRPPGDDYLRAILDSHDVWWFYPSSAQAFRRDFLERHQPLKLPPGLTPASDIRLAFLATLSEGGVATHDEAGALYRQRRGSNSTRTGFHAASRLEMNRMHVHCFNAYARAAGRPVVRPWRSGRHLLQFARTLLPRGLGDRLASWKARRASALRWAAEAEPSPAPVPPAGSRAGVSILINNYNNGRWLRESVDSALNQTRPADEVIVYDDGSSDDSLAILRSYGDRIRLIEGAHDDGLRPIASAGRAIAGALAASRGEHVYLLDGDDVFLPEKLAAYEAAWARKPEAVMVQAPMVRVDAEGVVLKPEYLARHHVEDHLKAIYWRQDCDFHYPTSALAFRRDFMERVLADEQALNPQINATDTNLATVAPLFGPVLTLEETLTWWRRTAKSLKSADPSSRLTKMRERHRWFNRWAKKTGARRLWLGLCAEYYKERLVEAGWVKRGGWLSKKVR